LNVDNQLGAFYLSLQLGVLALQAGHFGRLRVGLATPFGRSEAVQFPTLALVPPRGEMGGIRALSP
jgi:hypothetical protein